jgi:hypothetical protein
MTVADPAFILTFATLAIPAVPSVSARTVAVTSPAGRPTCGVGGPGGAVYDDASLFPRDVAEVVEFRAIPLMASRSRACWSSR